MRRRETRPKMSPRSRLLTHGCVDGRSREGRYLRACRAELAAHVGGEPSRAQAVLIDRIAWLRLHVVLFDEKIAAGETLSLHDGRMYMSFSNGIVRAMRELGLQPAAAKPPSLADYLAAKTAAEALT